jgi:hypothetical protein
MNRAVAQDRSMTWEARGMLAYLLSKPDDWRVTPADLEQQCGRERVKTILNELIEHGYATRSEEQPKDDKGRFSQVTYYIHETPVSAKPSTVEPTLHNIDIQSTENTNLSPAAKAAAIEVEPTPAKSAAPAPRKEQPTDVLFKTVASCAFGTEANYDSSRVAYILYGNPKLKCRGIIAVECQRQGKAKADLDYQQFARDAQAFWAWFKKTKPELKGNLIDCIKWEERWKEWRAQQAQVARHNTTGEIKMFFDEKANAFFGRTADGKLTRYHAGQDRILQPNELPDHLKWMAEGAKVTS